jgi:hypothetical protein
VSYGMSGALQAAVYQLLVNDTAVQALVGSAVYDAPPPGALPATYVTLGEEEVRDASSGSAAGARHDFAVTVISDAAGFATAKAAAEAVSDALLSADLTLTRGRVVELWFLSARARRVGTGDQRRIDLRFRARLEDE